MKASYDHGVRQPFTTFPPGAGAPAAKRGSIPALAAVGVVAAVGVGYAAIPGSDGMVSGCYGPAGSLGIESVASVSDKNSTDQKIATAYCPRGKLAISGGAQVLGPTDGLSGDPVAVNSINVFNSASSGSGAPVGALEVGGGTTNTWSLYATAVCVAVAG